jgi:hypothetical protein
MDMDTIDRTEAEATAKPLRAPKSEAASLLAAILKTGKDAAFSPEKFDSLIGLYERIGERDAKRAFHEAKLQMRPLLPVITRRGELIAQDEIVAYAMWEDICDEVLPILNQHGFDLAFRTGLPTAGKVSVIAVLKHVDGHEETAEVFLPPDPSGGKNPLQAVGSALSYSKRQAATLVINLTSRDEDDDGVAGGGGAAPDTITPAQVADLQSRIEAAHGDVRKLLAYFKITALADLPSTKLALAIRLADAKAGA